MLMTYAYAIYMPILLQLAFSLFLFAFSIITLKQLGSHFASLFTVTYSEDASYLADCNQGPFVSQHR